MKLVNQYITFFFNFSTTSNHLHPLQVENCDSNSRLVVNEYDNGKFRVERVKPRKSFFSLKISVVLRNTDIFMWSHTGGCTLLLSGGQAHRSDSSPWSFYEMTVALICIIQCQINEVKWSFCQQPNSKKRSYLRWIALKYKQGCSSLFSSLITLM